MPDQYDPKVSPRPSADRRQADARRGATMVDDPLAELAKIVQGRPTNGAAAPSRQAAAAAAATQANGSSGLDLEAELLNDLQASFAAVRDVFPSPPPPAAAARQPAAPVRAPLVVDEAPVAAAPAPQPASPPQPANLPPRNEAAPELRDEFRLEPVDQTRLVPIPAPPVIQPMIQSSAPAAPQPRPPMAERRPEPVPEKIAEPPVAERTAPKPRQPAPAPDLGAFQLRGSATASPSLPAAPPPRQPHSRWEKPEPPRAQPAAASRFAPPRTAAPVMDDEADLDPFAEGGLFADQFDQPAAEEEFPLEDLGTLPAYAEEEEHLPPLEDDLDGLSPRRGVSRNLIVVLGVVLIALVGGLGFAVFRGGNAVTGGGTPPTITADGNPTKITPDETTAANDSDGQNKLIYDRVNSGDQASTDTTLLTPDSGPIKDVGASNGNNAISRVIIPGGPGIDAPGTAQQQSAAAPPPAADSTTARPDPVGQLAATDPATATDPDAIQPIGPRKVRTVIVKPDGTIVSSAATDDAALSQDIAPTAPPAATSTDTATAKPVATDAAPTPTVTDDTAAITGNDGDALTITAPPADGTTATADATPVDPAPAPAADAPPATKPAATKPAAAKPAAKPANQQVATADTADDPSPIDIVPGGQAAAPAPSGVLVQISSQRTEDAARATYRDLQARYPNILGSYDVNIQRADVPDRGTFYRVRVGPFSQNDAQRLCDDLRQAGGDCVLAKR